MTADCCADKLPASPSCTWGLHKAATQDLMTCRSFALLSGVKIKLHCYMQGSTPRHSLLCLLIKYEFSKRGVPLKRVSWLLVRRVMAWR